MSGNVSGIDKLLEHNPIKKIPVVVSGNQGSVMIKILDADILALDADNLAGATGHQIGGVGIAAAIQDQLLAIQSAISQLRQDTNESKNNINVQFGNVNNQLLIMNGNFKRMGKQPHLRGELRSPQLLTKNFIRMYDKFLRNT